MHLITSYKVPILCTGATLSDVVGRELADQALLEWTFWWRTQIIPKKLDKWTVTFQVTMYIREKKEQGEIARQECERSYFRWRGLEGLARGGGKLKDGFRISVETS